jgi:hypothetical protein
MVVKLPRLRASGAGRTVAADFLTHPGPSRRWHSRRRHSHRQLTRISAREHTDATSLLPAAPPSSRAQVTLKIWLEPYVVLRGPKVFNLRTDPYERADITSNTHSDSMMDRIWLFTPAQAYVADMLQTLIEYPQRAPGVAWSIKLEARTFTTRFVSGEATLTASKKNGLVDGLGYWNIRSELRVDPSSRRIGDVGRTFRPWTHLGREVRCNLRRARGAHRDRDGVSEFRFVISRSEPPD